MKVVKYKDKIINCNCIRSVELVGYKEVRITDLNGDLFFFICDSNNEAVDLIQIIYEEMKGE